MLNNNEDDIKTSNHSNILNPQADKDSEIFEYKPIRWIDSKKVEWKEARNFIYCPNCEATGNNIIKNGKSIVKVPKQKYKCLICNRQFIASIHTIIKRGKLYDVCLEEYLKHPEKYDEQLFGATWLEMSSVRADKMIHDLIHHQFDGMIKNQQDYDTFVYLMVHNAYSLMEVRTSSNY